MSWDVFISHASEDKATVARPLAHRLEMLGLRVWLDETQLRVGDSLREKMDEGLRESRYGVVILSRSFFAKMWPKRELGALFARPDAVLPVWHGIRSSDVVTQWPLLADLYAISTSEGLDTVARSIAAVIDPTSLQRLCGCGSVLTTACDVMAQAGRALPESTSLYVAYVVSNLRATASDPPVRCNLSRSAGRCANILRRLANAYEGARASIHSATVSSNVKDLVEARRKAAQLLDRIQDWCLRVERLTRQRRKHFLHEMLSEPIKEPLSSAAEWLLAAIEEALNEYAHRVLKLSRNALVVLVEPHEVVRSRPADGILLIPADRFNNLPALILELCHEVGVHAFLRTQLKGAAALLHDVMDQEIQIAWHAVAEAHADAALLAHVFNWNVPEWSRSLTASLVESWTFRTADDSTRKLLVTELLVRISQMVELTMLIQAPHLRSEKKLVRISIVARVADLISREYNGAHDGLADAVVDAEIKRRAAMRLSGRVGDAISAYLDIMGIELRTVGSKRVGSGEDAASFATEVGHVSIDRLLSLATTSDRSHSADRSGTQTLALILGVLKGIYVVVHERKVDNTPAGA